MKSQIFPALDGLTRVAYVCTHGERSIIESLSLIFVYVESVWEQLDDEAAQVNGRESDTVTIHTRTPLFVYIGEECHRVRW